MTQYIYIHAAGVNHDQTFSVAKKIPWGQLLEGLTIPSGSHQMTLKLWCNSSNLTTLASTGTGFGSR